MVNKYSIVPPLASPNSSELSFPGNVRVPMAGAIQVSRDGRFHQQKQEYKNALLIQFKSSEELQEAMRNGYVSFDPCSIDF